MGWTEKYKKAVTFSYDDGVEQDLRLLSIFNKYNLKATFNINTGLNYDNSAWMYKELEVRRLNLWEHVKDYEGHEIAVHTITHPHLELLENELVDKEILEDKLKIKEWFGAEPVGMAYPYGTYNDYVLKKLPEYGIKYSRGVESSYNFDEQDNLLEFKPTCHHRDERLFELAEKFIAMKPDKPQIFYVWGHSYEFEGDHNWDRFEEFCRLISGRDDIFYGTNEDVLLRK